MKMDENIYLPLITATEHIATTELLNLIGCVLPIMGIGIFCDVFDITRMDKEEGRKCFYALSTTFECQIDKNPEPGRNPLPFTDSSKGAFSCGNTIDSPPQRCTL